MHSICNSEEREELQTMASFVGSCLLNFLTPGNGPSNYPSVRGSVPTTVHWSTSGHVVCKRRSGPGLPRGPTIAKTGDRLFFKVKCTRDGRRFVVALADTQNHSPSQRKSERIVGCLWDASDIADHFTTSSCNHLLSEILHIMRENPGVLSYHCEISGQSLDGQGPIFLGSSEDSKALATDDR